MRTVLTILCFLAVSGVELKAEMTVKEYRENIASQDANTVAHTEEYVNGLGEGIVWSNLFARRMKAPLFCQPEKLSLAPDNFTDILGRQIKKQETVLPKAKLDDMPIGLMLLVGLQETFPCKTK